MERKRQWEALLVIVAAATVPSALAFAPTAFVSFPCCRRMAVPAGSNTISSTTSRIAMSSANHEDPLWKKAWNRLDTLESAGLKQKGERDAPVLARGPGLKRALFWLGVAFLYKWYRARFINKIPVWDRQPQWNMVVTSREQEKELKAYTCKNCGSTLFIAKNREWFFKGDTGLGGLGCYTCGAKGEDNFVMDRDRILEDVGDDDDYFDYERPLDFVTAAERRALMKKAKGDEDVANQMLIDSQKGESTGGGESTEDVLDVEVESKTAIGDESNVEEDFEMKVEEVREGAAAELAADATVEVAESLTDSLEEAKQESPEIANTEAVHDNEFRTLKQSEQKKPKKKKKKPKSEKVAEAPKKEAADLSLDDLDILGMDEF